MNVIYGRHTTFHSKFVPNIILFTLQQSTNQCISYLNRCDGFTFISFIAQQLLVLFSINLFDVISFLSIEIFNMYSNFWFILLFMCVNLVYCLAIKFTLKIKRLIFLMVPPASLYTPDFISCCNSTFCISIYDYIILDYCITWALFNEAFESDGLCTKWQKP